MEKIIMNPSSIRVPENSLVLICGVQNSGKTTFVKNNFPKFNILCIDDVLFDVAKNNPTYDFYDTYSKTQDYILGKLVSLGCSDNIAILDSVGFKNSERLQFIPFSNCFSGVIQIVIHPPLKTILSRSEKSITKYHKQLEMRHHTPEEISKFWLIIQENINDGSIITGTDQTYILHNTDGVSITY